MRRGYSHKNLSDVAWIKAGRRRVAGDYTAAWMALRDHLGRNPTEVEFREYMTK